MGNKIALAESDNTVSEEEREQPEQDEELPDAEKEQQEQQEEEVEEDDSESAVAATEEVEEEEKLKVTVDDIKTAPMDYRFPTTNQAKHCYTRYNEFHKCIAEKGEDASECTKYAKYYRALCPGEWVEKWNEQRENGTFAGRY